MSLSLKKCRIQPRARSQSLAGANSVRPLPNALERYADLTDFESNRLFTTVM